MDNFYGSIGCMFLAIGSTLHILDYCLLPGMTTFSLTIPGTITLTAGAGFLTCGLINSWRKG